MTMDTEVSEVDLVVDFPWDGLHINQNKANIIEITSSA
jgi:hypothetical protein